MKRLLLLAAFIMAASPMLRAGDSGDGRHSVSFVISDPIWETAVFHDHAAMDFTGSGQGYHFIQNNDYRYTPHFAVEYMYKVNDWFSAGVAMDIQGTHWNRYDTFNGVKTSSKQSFFNLCILPTARFNYFNKGLVNLHSSVSLGIDINGGTEKIYTGKQTVVVPAIDLNFVGVSVGKGHWYGTFDLGTTVALYDKTVIFLLGSRLMRLGVTYKF